MDLPPVSSMDRLRHLKRKGYGSIPIDTFSPIHHEPVDSIRAFGLAGQSYYSRPNATIPEALPGVDEVPVLRRSVGEKLGTVNNFLARTSMALFGAEVELYIEDGLRSINVQHRLFDTEVPRLLKRNEPLLDDRELDRRKRQIIAGPSHDPERPSPHSTGGAVDVILRYRQDSLLFVPDTNVWIGHRDGDTAQTIDPDYYERVNPNSESDRVARNNRRIFYAVMTGAAFGYDSGLAVNPTEIWHWSYGDQLWALVKDTPNAFYGAVRD